MSVPGLGTTLIDTLLMALVDNRAVCDVLRQPLMCVNASERPQSVLCKYNNKKMTKLFTMQWTLIVLKVTQLVLLVHLFANI